MSRVALDAEVTPQVRRHFEAPDLYLTKVCVVRHKPGRRAVVQWTYDPNSHPSGRSVVVLGKFLAKDRCQASYDLQAVLRGAGFNEDHTDGAIVPRPVGVVAAWKMWLQEQARGSDGWRALRKDSDGRFAWQIAAAVAKLQDARVAAQRIHTLDDELGILDDRLERAAAERPHLADRIARLQQNCRELTAALAPAALAPAHRDYYPDQTLWDGQRLCLLDFDLYCQSDPRLDVGNFVGHLYERAVREPQQAAVWALAAVRVMDAFLTLRPDFSRADVEALATLTLARHVHLSMQFPERRHAAEALLELCERRIRGRREQAAFTDDRTHR